MSFHLFSVSQIALLAGRFLSFIFQIFFTLEPFISRLRVKVSFRLRMIVFWTFSLFTSHHSSPPTLSPKLSVFSKSPSVFELIYYLSLLEAPLRCLVTLVFELGTKELIGSSPNCPGGLVWEPVINLTSFC